MIGEADRLLQIVGDEQHADALALDQLGDVADDAGAHDGVQGGERLVHQDELRPHRQDLRERHALALAAAEMAREAILEAGEPEPVKPLVGLRARSCALDAAEGQPEGDVLACRLPRQQGVVLEEDANLRSFELAFDPARRGSLETDDGAQQARLAGARRSDEAYELALLELDICAFQDRLTAVGQRQVGDAQGASSRRSTCRAARTCCRRL